MGISGGEMAKLTGIPQCHATRAETPFRLLVNLHSSTGEGESNERYYDGFDIVCDCTGSYRHDLANFAGTGGLPALGERKLRAEKRIWTTIPDILGEASTRFEGRLSL